jgi:nucleoside phosphorylase
MGAEGARAPESQVIGVSADGSGPVLVLSALDLEYQAVRVHLARLRQRIHPAGTLFETGHLPRGGGEITIAMTGEGNTGAAILAERAIAMLRPRALLFVGVAGTLKDDISLGDIVVATKIYAYHGGKDASDGFLARPRAWDAPHELAELARQITLTASWTRYLTPDPAGQQPKVHFKPIAAGEVLLNSACAPLAEQLRRTYNDAVAVETESAGISQASQLNRSVPLLVIRGISDRADADKQAADRAGWQHIAAVHAAGFALTLAAALNTQRRSEHGAGSQHSNDEAARLPHAEQVQRPTI